ncbi:MULTISPECIES: 3-isopropylmalate dehydratase large subunit [Bradyrhizobium]|uniref:3-isopropylmalate dehydratase large subunit n=1 Tax=Bradyrhizobium TaxID=374 RepID=UPI0013E8EDD3|nr:MULTISPECIES: 3-isopropylmalate dehydratase large subunit [Bradyrhizobium]
MQPRSIFEKIWNSHVIREMGDGVFLLYVDRHIIQESASGQAFDGLRRASRSVRRPDLTFGVTDHIVSTRPGRTVDSNPEGRELITLMERNCSEHGIELFDLADARQGIEHVVAPELGLITPGMTVVCADSHTPTNGALGAYAWGFGTSDVEHVLATQTVLQRKPKALRVTFAGRLGKDVCAKDLILYLIGKEGTQAARGYAIEYCGPVIRAMSMEGRMTICNMSIEFGGRAGMIGPDDTTYEYIAGRDYAPKGAHWQAALDQWRTLNTDEQALFDKEIRVNCSEIAPQVTWGTTPGDVVGIDENIPDPVLIGDPVRRAMAEQALHYIGLKPNQPLEGIPINVAFIGSCTNSRLSDLQAAAAIVKGRKVAKGVRALVVPGSTSVKRAAEALGLNKVFLDAGFDWREAGCSMCLGINDDQVAPGERCMATSNRNFEHRQGPNSRTHLASPASVAAAAVTGVITDVRKLAHA